MTEKTWKAVDKNIALYFAIVAHYRRPALLPHQDPVELSWQGTHYGPLTRAEYLAFTAKEPEVLETDDENHS